MPSQRCGFHSVMSLQGPLLIVAEKPAGGLVQAFTDAGAFPVVEARWAEARAAAAEIKPSAVVLCEPDTTHRAAAAALARQIVAAQPFVPMIVRLREDEASGLPHALPIAEDAPVDQLIARVAAGLRLRALHATVLGRARALKAERNIVAELPKADPLDDATVLLVGRGRFHPTLSVAVGERMGVIGALSVDTAARCLTAREVDGVLIGDGLPAASVEVFLALLAEDVRFRHLPVALLGTGGVSLWALRLAKAAGHRVIVTSSDDDKLLRVRGLGADATVNYRRHPDWGEEILRLTAGVGVDRVLDIGGPDTVAQSITALRTGGSVAIIGRLTGMAPAQFDPAALFGGAKRLLGLTVGSRAQTDELARFVEQRRIRPVIDQVFPFEQAREAYARLASARHLGKVVIAIA
jgi:hypothetical protein